MAEPQQLLEACEAAISAAPAAPAPSDGAWSGLRVLVTAGGTREPIDSVRYVGNSSSGRMGLALAAAARARGADVTLIAANVALPAPAGVQLRRVSTASELALACEQEFDSCDVLLMAAAVADFAPAAPAREKLKKADRSSLQVVLEPTADVLAGLSAARKPGQTLVGFAAEHGADAVAAAASKLTAKGLDALVVNDISRADIGFDVDSNEVTILTGAPANGAADGAVALQRRHVPRASKREVAETILDAVQSVRASR